MPRPERVERAAANVGELTPLLLDPRAVLAGQEGLPQERRGQRGGGLRLLQVAGRERSLGLPRRVRATMTSTQRSFGQVEPVAAERARQTRSRRRCLRLRAGRAACSRSPVSALSQVAGGVSPQSASASSSRGTGLPCSATRYANRSRPCRPGKRASSITTPSALDRDPTREENLQLQAPSHSLAQILPRFGGAFLASPRGIVDKVLHCDCGFEARAADEEGLVAEVRRHAWEAHGMALSHDEALLLAFRAELDEEAPTAIARKTSSSRPNKEEQ